MRHLPTSIASAVASLLLLGLSGCGGSTAATTDAFETAITTQARAVAGLDVAAWQACLPTAAPGARIDADQALGVANHVRGTPTYFVNGATLLGATFQELKTAIDGALAAAQASGVPAAEYYARTVPGIPVSDSPSLGPADAWVTVVEFSDFECPYCAQATNTLDQVKLAYPGSVRIVFKHFPLSFHPQARPAAIAAECAHAQGKFWEMHDLIFRNQASLF
jgi:protein-disulfide isomerase